jgi:hypothetical protein
MGFDAVGSDLACSFIRSHLDVGASPMTRPTAAQARKFWHRVLCACGQHAGGVRGDQTHLWFECAFCGKQSDKHEYDFMRRDRLRRTQVEPK